MNDDFSFARRQKKEEEEEEENTLEKVFYQTSL